MLTGVSEASCRAQGGVQFVPTNTGGRGPEVGECYIPPNLNRPGGGGVPAVGRGGGTAGAVGAGLLGLGAIVDQVERMRAASGNTGNDGNTVLPLPSHLQDILDGYQPPPGAGSRFREEQIASGRNPFAGRPTEEEAVAEGPGLGVLALPEVQDEITATCGARGAYGSVAYRVCETDARAQAIMARDPTAKAQCDGLHDPARQICALRVNQETFGLQPGECIGDCTDSVGRMQRVRERLQRARDARARRTRN
jgi:hypothetical protein